MILSPSASNNNFRSALAVASAFLSDSASMLKLYGSYPAEAADYGLNVARDAGTCATSSETRQGGLAD